MSQYYELGDTTLWNPSNGASRLFQRQVAMFEAELGMASGIGAMDDDDAQVVPALLKPFTDALLAWSAQTPHPVVHALSDGFVATVLVLAERAGVAPAWPKARRGTESWANDLRTQATQMSRAMAR